MAVPQHKTNTTVENYLQLERRARNRHYFLDGAIHAMAGESGRHADISVNLVVLIGSALHGSHCRVRSRDTKVRSGPAPVGENRQRGLYSYPDIVVICGEPEYHDAVQDVILNPKVVIEVLSKSTEALDRGDKFKRYQDWNPSLTDYLLVSQEQPEVEHFTVQKPVGWKYSRHHGLKSKLQIESIGVTLRLKDIYARITFGK